MNIAKAHTREGVKYPDFHLSLLKEDTAECFALRYLYSVRNVEFLLTKTGWSAEDIKRGKEHLTIAVDRYLIYAHIPNKINKKDRTISIRGLSRNFSKKDFINALIERAWKRADPYKLEQGDTAFEFIAQGVDEFYELQLRPDEITCTCPAYRNLVKAFNQDSEALKILKENERLKGQYPDKHVLAVWKYLNCESFNQYQYQIQERAEKALCDWERQQQLADISNF